MATAYEKLVRHFADRELRYTAHDDRQTVMADFRGEVGAFRLMARVDDDDSLLQVFAYIPIRATPGSRSAIAEAVSRANFGMKVGKFELDMSDGELLYQAAHILVPDDLGETFLPDHVIGRLVGTALAMVDKYTPAYLSIIYGNETPEDAIRCVETPATTSVDETLRDILEGSSTGSADSENDSDESSSKTPRGDSNGTGGDEGVPRAKSDRADEDLADEDSEVELDGQLDGELGDDLADAGRETFEPLKDWSPDRDSEES
ncbi:MAG: YbjN domain-containing protein [Planctomycetota bacterium]